MKTLLIVILAASLAGCTTNEYVRKRGDDSVTFKRTSFGLTQAIGEISVSTDQAGRQTLRVSGYENRDSAIVGAAVEAAIKAVGKP